MARAAVSLHGHPGLSMKAHDALLAKHMPKKKKSKPATKRSRKSAATGARRPTKWSVGVGFKTTAARDSVARSMQRLDDELGEAGALAVLGALLERESAKVKKEREASTSVQPKKR